MANRLLVDSLLDEVRSIISERNTTGGLDNDFDILPALNRGQDRAASILAKHHADPLVKIVTVALVNGQLDYDIPEDAFEDRIVKLEVDLGRRYTEMKRVKPTDFGAYETPSNASIPLVYGVFGRKYRVLPTTTGAYSMRLMYLMDPPKLDVSQGRISLVNEGSNYVRVDSITGSLDTDVEAENSYVSVVDGQSGQIKGVLQVQTIGTTTSNVQITFRSTPQRTTIDNYTTTGSLVGLNVQVGDYLCLAPATCISTLRKPVINFIVSYSALLLQEAALGGPGTDKLQQMADDFEKDVKALWAGQEHELRVKPRNSVWGARRRSSWPFPQGRGM